MSDSVALFTVECPAAVNTNYVVQVGYQNYLPEEVLVQENAPESTFLALFCKSLHKHDVQDPHYFGKHRGEGDGQGESGELLRGPPLSKLIRARDTLHNLLIFCFQIIVILGYHALHDS